MQSRVVWELCRVGSRWGARCGETLLGGRRCSVGGHRLPPCSSFSSPPSSAPKPSRKTTSVSYILFLFFKYAFTGLRRFVYTGSHISLALPFSVVCVSFSPAFTICIKLPSRHYIYQQHFFFALMSLSLLMPLTCWHFIFYLSSIYFLLIPDWPILNALLYFVATLLIPWYPRMMSHLYHLCSCDAYTYLQVF